MNDNTLAVLLTIIAIAIAIFLATNKPRGIVIESRQPINPELVIKINGDVADTTYIYRSK